MRTIAALVVLVLVSLPEIFAGWPGTAPGWFDQKLQGVPMSIVAMSALMLAFVVLAGVCSALAKDRRLPGAE